VTLFKRIGPGVGWAVVAWLCTGSAGAQEHRPNALPTTLEVPNAFGVNSWTVTTVSATSFYPSINLNYGTSPSLGRSANTNTLIDYYVGVDIPAGAVIDYIGLNSTTDTAFVL